MWMKGTLPLLALVLMGCARVGPERASVSGTVLVDGQPFESGTINFIPPNGSGPTAGSAIEDGEYSIERATGPVVGETRVEIRGNRKTGRKIPHPMSPKETVDELVEAIPPEFNANSTLTRKIKPGDNTLNFELPSTRPHKK